MMGLVEWEKVDVLVARGERVENEVFLFFRGVWWF
jgi:hypothetical protein